MKIIKIVVVLLILGLVVWIDLPENLPPIKVSYKSFKVNFKIKPLSINYQFLGIKIKKDFKTHYGLDLKGGSHLVFETDISKLKPEDISDAIKSSRDIIEKRVNFFGVTEPVVKTIKSGNNYRILVDLPGIKNVSEAIQLIGKTAQLTFKEEATSEAKVATSTPLFLRLTKESGLTGRHIKKAKVVFDSQTGKPQVGLEFTEQGGKLFTQVTKRNLNKPLGIFIDKLLISAPVVSQVINDNNAVITGNFSVKQAKKLAISINSGALPISIKLIEQRNIGPTLGAEQVRKSVYAGMIGLVAVILFMIGYYGRFGLIATMALLIYGMISLAIFRIISVVLTLPGVAGFILSIGMAVDANILIFERIKEEIRKGKKLEIAIQLGFGRALDAIKDANFTTLLVAFILFNPLNWDFLPQFGMVRGFALTLAIGVSTSLFTGVVITKRLIDIFYKETKA